jgi:putative membrane-bound dehydrogenase-like protein
MMIRCTALFVAALVAATFTKAEGEDKTKPPTRTPASTTNAPDLDYSAELPRSPLRSPPEAQQAFVVRPGFRVELVAAEPLLRSPVAMDFDEDGRIYIAEFPEYNEYANTKSQGTGCIRLLEDTHGNGIYDKSTLFAANVPRAVAVTCWDGGVYVGSTPDVLYFKDTDGDGKADVRRVVFTGFPPDRNGESMLNSFRWGLDNRIHLSTNLGGGDIRRADQPKAATVSVRGHGLLFDPRTETFALTGGGGQHGMSMDDWGRMYVCGNSDPFHLIMYDSRYLARNPYLVAPPAAVNVAEAGRDTKLYRISPVEPWRALRTRLRTQKLVPGSDEGGSPSGFFTGGTGVTVYRGDAFPPEFHGNLFVADVANNVVHRASPVANGVGVIARSVEKGREFLASRDHYFRPVQMANGPDGCLYIIDMYRELIEGAAFLPPQILKHMDVGRGADYGRIWRVVPEGHKPRMPRLSKATTPELVALLEHPNGWHRDTASRLLYQRQDRSAVEPLRKLAANSKSPLGRTHALYALEGLGALKADLVLAALSDPDAQVRGQALRLAEPFCKDELHLQKRLENMVDDPDVLVRYQLAFSLGELPGTKPAAALAALAIRDGADRWVRVAVLSSITGRAGEVFRRLAGNADFRAERYSRTFLTTMAVQIGAAESTGDLAAVLKTLNDGTLASEQPLARDVMAALVSKMPAATRARLTGVAEGKAGAILAGLLSEARKTAVDDKKSAAARAAAIHALNGAVYKDVQGLLAEMLASHQPPDVQAAAIKTLGSFGEAGVPAVLLRAWPGMSPKLRATAAETIFARPEWIGVFLDAVEKGTVGRSDVDPARLDLLRKYPVAEVRTRAAKLFAAGLARRQDVVAAYQKALQLKGDRERGKAVFKANCSSCHRLEGVGQQVGAELSAIRDRGLDAVLLNILDPNREVLPQYLSYMLVTKSGRVLTGMITAETANSLTIRKPDGSEETVLRLQIEELRSTGLSYMPEGLEQQINVPAMADLLAYLNSVK